MALEIRIIPALTDNYVYLLRDGATGIVAVVDPSTPEAVMADVEKSGLRPPALARRLQGWLDGTDSDRFISMPV